MMSILITGGAGFIGSNFIPYFLERYRDVRVVNLDALTYAADLSNLKSIEGHPRYTFIEGDICDVTTLEHIFDVHKIKGVIHFAAESHVDNSISSPSVFMRTNVLGTFNLLNTAKNYWMKAPFEYRNHFQNCRFHHISTDEVYGSLETSAGLFSETTPYSPNSPYSASKASSDMIVRSYFHTYGLSVVTTNCSNNYGPKQHEEKLIPTIIRKALSGEAIPIYGDGTNIRDWLYVKDHCRGIDLVYQKGTLGEVYNIGGRNEKTNLQVVSIICKTLDRLSPSHKPYERLITFVKDRHGHDKRYAIDASKIEENLGWKAGENFQTGILKTVQWYLENY